MDVLPFYHDASFTPHWITTESEALDTFHRIGKFEFINQDGKRITEKMFDQKIYVANFFFTSCPGICPKMTNNMTLIQARFRNDDDVLLLSHSVTPERDSISVLKMYGEQFNIDPEKWHLTTGDRQMIYEMGRNVYFIEEDLGNKRDPDEFLHTENFVLVDQNKFIRGIYNGLSKASVNQLIADIELLQQEGKRDSF